MDASYFNPQFLTIPGITMKFVTYSSIARRTSDTYTDTCFTSLIQTGKHVVDIQNRVKKVKRAKNVIHTHTNTYNIYFI